MHDSDTVKPKLALLIDADNISAKYLPTILNEAPKHGVATYRRIFGDFTDPQAASWRGLLLDNSILPVQQFSNVKAHKPGESAGKNATDSALIIEAMDILYAGKVDGFIIVSSDSDFTRLASRLRESNMIVIGMGCNHTSTSFRNACTKFVNIERIHRLNETAVGDDSEDDAAIADETVDTDGMDIESGTALQDVEDVIAGIIRDNDSKGVTTTLAALGSSLNNKFPDFDVRNFGYTQLSKFVEEMPRFDLAKEGTVYSVSIASMHDAHSRVADFVRETLAGRKSKAMGLAPLGQLVHKEFPSFNIKDAGYSQFAKFISSINGVRVEGGRLKQAKLDR